MAGAGAASAEHTQRSCMRACAGGLRGFPAGIRCPRRAVHRSVPIAHALCCPTQQHQIQSLVRIKIERDRRENSISEKKQRQANKKQKEDIDIIVGAVAADIRHTFADPFIPEPNEEDWNAGEGEPLDPGKMSPRMKKKWEAQQVCNL